MRLRRRVWPTRGGDANEPAAPALPHQSRSAGLARICLTQRLWQPSGSPRGFIFLSARILTTFCCNPPRLASWRSARFRDPVGGIDLSVGSVMVCPSVICATRRTKPGMDAPAAITERARRDPCDWARGSAFWRGSSSMASSGRTRGPSKRAGGGTSRSGPWRGYRIPVVLGSRWPASRPPLSPRRRCRGKFGVAGGSSGDALCRAGVGAINGDLIVEGRPPALHRDARDDGQRPRHRPPDRRARTSRSSPSTRARMRRKPLKLCVRWSGASAGAQPCSFFVAILFFRCRPALHHLTTLRLRDRRQCGGGEAFGRQGQAGRSLLPMSFRPYGLSRRRSVRRPVSARQAGRRLGPRTRRDRRRRHRRNEPDGKDRGGLAGTFVGVLIFRAPL